MGLPMAKNLLKAGYSLKAFNRSQKKAEALKEFGAEIYTAATSYKQARLVFDAARVMLKTLCSDSDKIKALTTLSSVSLK